MPKRLVQEGYAVIDRWGRHFFTSIWHCRKNAIDEAIDGILGSEHRATPDMRKSAWKQLRKKYGFYATRARMQEIR